jgi:hypothetical protein
MSNMIPLSGMETIEFVPSAFEGQENPPTFFIRVPTFAIRDKMAAILFQRGLIPATVPMGRAILIDALFELYDEAQAEEEAAFLEGFWTKAEIHDELTQAWQIREAQRIFDLGMGVKKDLPQEPIPQAPFSMREQARQARIISDALDRHERYRSFQARFMVSQQEEEDMTIRLFLKGWKNCVDRSGEFGEIEVCAAHDDMDRLLESSIEAVRQFLSDQGAPTAWDEIRQAVKNQFGAPEALRKNFDSPLDTNSSQNGLLNSSGDLAISDGNSTTSSITPARNTGSPLTSGGSSRSRGGKSGRSKEGRRKNGQTAAVS